MSISNQIQRNEMSKPDREHRIANLERWKAMHGLRSSNAAQPHIPAALKGTRTSKKNAEIKKSLNEDF